MAARSERTLQVASDELGFATFCEEAGIAWVRAPHVIALAERGGPVPRRQELSATHVIIGRPPHGRKIVVSHGWDASKHIDPTGVKVRALAAALRGLGATGDEDGVFIE